MFELGRLYRVRKTTLQMLRDRGYAVSQDMLDQTLENFKTQYENMELKEVRADLQMKWPLSSDQTQEIFVFFPEEQKLTSKRAQEYGKSMEANFVKRAIIIVQTAYAAMVKQAIQNFKQGGIVMETFMEQELLVNITEHVLVPKHVVLTTEERDTLLKRYKLKLSQLPRMQQVDPISRYYGLERGQVAKIIRPSETAGKYVTYRCVF